jgi:hypothetical protein
MAPCLLPLLQFLQGEVCWTLNVTDAAPGAIQASVEDGDPASSTFLGEQQPPAQPACIAAYPHLQRTHT